MTSTTAAPNLLVPMNVDAIAIGKDSNHWILNVPDFASGMSRGHFLGYQQLPRDMWSGRACPYDPGVHLRWALPDGLTQAHAADPNDKEAKDFTYPDVPNRWVVLRLYTDSSQRPLKPVVRAWMVESDFITNEKVPGASQWPVLPTTSNPPRDFHYMRYVGRQIDLAGWPASGGAQYLSDLGARLTAVGYGNAIYAAHYPVCATVFGFHDDMSDFAGAGPDAPVSLTYLVAGWYADPRADVLYDSANPDEKSRRWQDKMATLNWAWYPEGEGAAGNPPPSPQPTRTITHGFVSQVKWMGKDYAYNYGAGRVSPKLAAGNTSLEALAALIAANASGGENQAALEKVLIEFQNDFLSVYDKDADPSAIDRELNELLHAASFGSRSGGVVYEIRRKNANAPASADRSGDAVPGVDLPTKVGEALTDLNMAQDALQNTATELASCQQEYFHAWHKQADGMSVPDALFEELTQKIVTDKTALSRLEASVVALKDAVKSALDEFLPAYELGSRALPRFWQPTDFALLVANTGRTFRHGEDGQFTQTGDLECRVSGSTLASLNVDSARGNVMVKMPVSGIAVAAPPHTGSESSGDFDRTILPDLEALLLETVLLDPNQAMYLAERFGASSGLSATDLAADIQALQAIHWNAPADKNPPDLSGSAGRVPSPAAVTYWLDNDGNPGNPWVPLMMQWEFDWYPTYQSGAGVPQALKRWTFSGADYTLDPKYQIPADATSTYDGITVLTPSAVWNLQRRLEAYNQRNLHNPDRQSITDLVSALSKLDILSQAVGGANLSLTMRDQSLQLPPIDRSTGGHALASDGGTVVDLIDKRYETAPWASDKLNENQYLPVRAGHAVLTRVNVVDAFGQFLSVPPQALTISTQLKCPTTGHIGLRPRLSQHARLGFDLVSAEDDSVVSGIDPATTPVCGWIVPDYLDRSLLLSSADGAVLGKLRQDADGEKVLWIPDPVLGPAQDDTAQAGIPNSHLMAMQAALLGVAGADFGKFVDYIEQVEETIYPGGSQINSRVNAFMGTPIAVVRAALRLQFDGRPVFNQAIVGKADDHGYSEIGFPVALGDIGHPGDGLFGYFTPPPGLAGASNPGGKDATSYAIFYAAGGADASGLTCPYLVQPDPNDPPIQLAAYTDGKPSPPICVTLLVDPRTQIKAQTGILPARTLRLPSQDISAVLASHEIFFQVSPVISSARVLSFPHPSKKYGSLVLAEPRTGEG